MSNRFRRYGEEPPDFHPKMHDVAGADSTARPYIYGSIWNEFGRHGSIWPRTSTSNPQNIYRSEYSNLSRWDPNALDLPYILVSDERVANLNANYLLRDAIDSWDYFDWVERISYRCHEPASPPTGYLS